MTYYEAVLEYLRNEPDPNGRITTQISIKTGIPKHALFKVLKNLVHQGYLTREAMKLGCGNNHAEYIYTVVE